MAGPTIRLVETVKPQGTDAVDVGALRALIRTSDAAEAIQFDGRAFVIVKERIALLNDASQSIVIAAAARANVDPAVQNLLGGAAQGEGAGIDRAIEAVVEKFGQLRNIAKDARTFFAGAKAEGHWWGLELFCSKDSAEALAAMVSTDLQAAMVLLQTVGLVISKAVALIVSIVGELLASYIKTENGKSPNGVKISLYLFVFPEVEGR